MTIEQKNQICALRQAGRTYTQIARALRIHKAAVKSFCYRNNVIVVDDDKHSINKSDSGTLSTCEYCGTHINQPEHRKKKRFCCDRCRIQWWNQNRSLKNARGKLEKTCPVCHASFYCYERSRKYCSFNCYIQDRFGGAQSENNAV